MPPPPRPQSFRTRQPLPPKLGIPSQQTQPRTPPPSPPSHPAASGLCSSSSSENRAESAKIAGSAAPTPPTWARAAPVRPPQTPQTHPAHRPARGPKRRGNGRGGEGTHLLAFVTQRLGAPPAARSRRRRLNSPARPRTVRNRQPTATQRGPTPARSSPSSWLPPATPSPPVWSRCSLRQAPAQQPCTAQPTQQVAAVRGS